MTPATNPRNRHGEFKLWLHVFSMHAPKNGIEHDIASVHQTSHHTYPWMWEEEVPNFEALAALWHITGFAGLPEQYCDFWYTVRYAKRLELMSDNSWRGPYWMVLPQMQLAALAQSVVGIKNRTRNLLFKSHSVNSTISSLNNMIYSALRPFLITNLGDEFNETERTGEVGRRTVQEWHSPPPNRPPRCG